MKKNDIIKVSTDIVNEIIKDTDIKLYDIEYVKEGPFKYLRIFIEKEDESTTIEDCENISREFNNKIDDDNFVDEQYYLEVSTPGIDRPFKSEKDYTDNIGKNVEVSLYKNVNLDKKKLNVKSFTAKMLSKDGDAIKLAVKVKTRTYEIEVDIKDIAKINSAVEFNKEG